MILKEQTTVPSAALPIPELREHLRLGTGFTDDALQDGVLERCLRAALAGIEARTGKALITRDFRWTIAAWREWTAQTLPIAPVSVIHSLTIVDRFDAETVVDAGSYWLERDSERPQIVAAGVTLPTIPVGGTAAIDFEAGFGATWGDMPADIAQAVMLLAAHYYENRAPSEASNSGLPSLVATLIERYRRIRTFGGGLV